MFQREFVFRGKHALYVTNLVEIAGLIQRNLDVLIIAPIIGLLYGKTGALDKSSNNTKKIFTEQLLKEKDLLEFIYKLIILSDTTKGWSAQDKIFRAFRIDEEADNLSEKDKQMIAENRQLFESYLLGGIEYLHEKLYGNGTYDKDEMLNKLYEFIKKFYEDLQTEEYKLGDIINESIIG